MDDPTADAPPNTSCPGCGRAFRCGAGDATCWCAALPSLAGQDLRRDPLLARGGGCLCRNCLESAIARLGAGRL